MAFAPYGYQNPYYPPPMQDNLMQMRQQQMVPQMPQQMAPQNPIAQSGVQWVSGEQEARNWMIAPNAAVALWDSSAPTVYLKKADASGKPSLTIYDLVERAETPHTAPTADPVKFVTREEFDALAAVVDGMKGKKKAKEADADG